MSTNNKSEESVGQPDKTEQHDDDNNDNDVHSRETLDENRIVRHIMVIGFHHKHGYQVDYCYPPLTVDGPTFTTLSRPITLPSCWKTLPLLCLPDGSHNYDSDTIYFTMPDLEQDNKSSDNNETHNSDHQHQGIKTIFGTACYRQIHVEKLLNRTDDMTRVAVQKSVCILSTQPLFGLIRSKLEMITHAYFEELDFSKVRILKLTYDNLNSLLTRQSVRENATFLGLSARHLVSYFGNNMLVLFKAMLLEKKILFYKSPVRDLCTTIMSMCSLFTGLLECGGLNYSTCDLQLSPTLLEALKLEPKTPRDESSPREGRVFFSPSKEEVVIINDLLSSSPIKNELIDSEGLEVEKMCNTSKQYNTNHQTTSEFEVISDSFAASAADANNSNTVKSNSQDTSLEPNLTFDEETIIDDQQAHKLCQMSPEECGFPLQIFTRGSFCLPYLSISYLDLLSDKRVRSFVIGATNFLFKQRREMYDVIVDMEDGTISIGDATLKRCLSLTIEDLRFMDYLQKHVKFDANSMWSAHDDTSMMFDPISQDVTKWLGGDEWIRYHFKIYTLYLLKSAKTQSNLDSFNGQFIQAWKSNTNNYRIWDSTNKSTLLNDLQSKHPFSSSTRGLNFSDMKLKLSYAVNSSDKGRIVNQTLTGIGKWSIWNNIAAAGNAAATTVSTIATSAANATLNQVQQSTASSSDKQNEPFQSPSDDALADGESQVVAQHNNVDLSTH